MNFSYKFSVSLLAGFFLILPLMGQTQESEKKDLSSEERKEKIESYRIAFVTSRLDLTPAEAEKFWPVYNEYRSKKDALQKELWRKIKEYKEFTSVSEDQARELVDAGLEEMKGQYNTKKEFITRLRTFFPDERIVKLEKAEWDFKKELLKRLDEFKADQSEK